MPRTVLSDAAISEALTRLPKWSRDGKNLLRTLPLRRYRDAEHLLARLIDVAEGADHHPDLEVHYAQIVVRLSTHDAGGITTRDVHVARVFEDLFLHYEAQTSPQQG